MSYMQHLKKCDIVLLGEQILLFKSVNMDTHLISLIIVPTSICRKLFDHYHTWPSGEHMEEYNMLYILCLFWSGLR